MKILGISAFYHDSAAALVEDGVIIAAAQEERFSRVKNDQKFPAKAIEYCLHQAELNLNDLDAVVFYDKPFLKFERIIQTFMDVAPKGWWQFVSAIPSWLKEKLFIKNLLKDELSEIGVIDWKTTQLLFSKHHLSHAASSFFPSNFKEAAILTIDGVGEWSTASIAKGEGSDIQTLKELHFPNSLGLLYSAFTYYLGFKVNSGEYKLMGLAPYGNQNTELANRFYDLIKEHIVQIHDDGSIALNQEFFAYTSSFKMINESMFTRLFGFPKRQEEWDIAEKHYCLALAVQDITEEVVLKMAKEVHSLTGSKNLCLAGGVALNCVANGKLQEAKIFENIYVQPASGDAGNALGAALSAHYMHFQQKRYLNDEYDQMSWARLGPEYTAKSIERSLKNFKLKFEKLDKAELIELCAKKLYEGNTIGWFQGRMEFGPRALGGRSILGNPTLVETQSKLNLKVKQRESFRPFAPIMLEDEFAKYFGLKQKSPYMLFVHKILEVYRINQNSIKENLIEKINEKRSNLPAITHVDYSARIQTVNQKSDPLMFKLLRAFKQLSGEGVLVNTSFNLRGEPIVCNPSDAIRTFLSTELDMLVLGEYVVYREQNLDLLATLVNVKLD